MIGFFTSGELTKKTEITVDVDQLQPDCLKCKLYKNCNSPKMKRTGEGKKKILIIGEFPSSIDDSYGVPFSDTGGEMLRDYLHKEKISLAKDCWKMNAVNCRPSDNKPPTHKQIKACFPKVEKAILKLKPKVIILLGPIAITSLYGSDFSDRSINRWRQYIIPDEKFKCHVLCLFSPYQLKIGERNTNLHAVFQRDVKKITVALNRTYKEQKNYEQYVTVLKDFSRVKKLLKRIIQRKAKIVFDYETTGLKPYRAGHKIVSLGIAVSPIKAFAFPFNYKNFWTPKEFHIIKKLWTKILLDKEIKKIAHGTKFEEMWSTVLICDGKRPKNMYWCSMIAEHCFPKEVEFLTSKGWKSCKDVTMNDNVAQLDLQSREISYSNPLRLIKSKTKELLHVKSKILNFCCTPNHDIVRVINAHKLEKLQVCDVIKKYQANFLGAGIYKGTKSKFIKKELKLYAALLTDGFFHKGRKKEISGFGFVFKKERKIKRVIDILTENKIHYTKRIRKQDNATCINIHNKKLAQSLFELFPEKLLNFNFEKQLNYEELLIFVYEFNFFDGSYTYTESWPNSIYIGQKQKQNIDVLQSMLCKIGYRVRGISRNKKTEYGKCKFYALTANKKPHFTCQFKSATIQTIKKCTDVFCVTTQKGTLITRYKGHVLVMGNCLDNRKRAGGLKFQTFVKFGVRPYDKIIKSFLKSKNGEFNTIEQAPFKELLIYNGLDCVYTWMLYENQKHRFSGMKGLSRAYGFFMRGIYTMGTIQFGGINVDTQYYKDVKITLGKRIDKLSKYLLSGREASKFKKTFGRDIKITSNQDLGKLFYEVLGKNPIYTNEDQINYKTDKATLETLNLPFVDKLTEMKRLEKAKGTYLGQFARESYQGVMHPFFDLHIPVSYRSCIAEGSKVLVMRDFESHKEGVPIETVKEGDYVYCFDDNLNPSIQRVKWTGRTGHKKVVRIHWYRKGKKGHLDCTPEHRIRLINGKYVRADELLIKEHYSRQSKKQAKCRVLACGRHKDRLTFTRKEVCEHRLIYKELIDNTLKDSEVVHHKDKNHFNHSPSNLEKMSKSNHAKLHSVDTICSEKSRKNNIKAIKKGWREGKYKNSIKKGKEHSKYLDLSKWFCLRTLAKYAGQIKIASDNANLDFGTFKNYIIRHGINPKIVKLRYDKHGKYISKARLQKLSILGRKKVKQELGHNHYKLLDLYAFYNIDPKRKWANQFGEFAPGNHVITKIEILDKLVNVYDIEVDNYHNFIVNEICVHNSSSMPNFQNLPKRDKEITSIIRKGIIPSPNSVICEADFSGAEVVTSCCYHKDKNFYNYLMDKSTDMHRDNATDLWMLPPGILNDPSYTNEQKGKAKIIRFFAKNLWTFAQFYGDWFGSCAPNLYETCITSENLELPTGILLKDHLENQGIYELGEMTKYGPTPGSFLEHCAYVEDKMWNERFPEYTQWKKDIVKFYQKYGYIETYFGFRFVGYMDSKQCCNFPIQGCLQGHSKVLTSKGWKRIDSLVNEKVKVWTGFSWKDAVGVDRGKYQLATVHLESGLQLDCDTRHEFKNEKNEWIKFTDLKENDFVAIPKTMSRIENPEVSIDWYFILGFAIGDGWFGSKKITENNTRYVFNLFGGESKYDILDVICEFLQKYHTKGFTKAKIIQKKENVRVLHVEGRKMAEKLLSFGYKCDKTAHTKSIPLSVWNGNKKQQQSFMDGLWLSDGSRKRKSLHMCNESLLKEVQVLLFGLGYDSFLRKTNDGWKLTPQNVIHNTHTSRKYPRTAFDMIWNNHKLNTKPRNEYIVNKRNINSNDDIGQITAERILSQKSEFSEIYRYDKVTKIEIHNREENTYTMSVNDKLHQFVADGIICKNTSFHLLVYTLIMVDKFIVKHKLRTKLIGQVHDSVLADVHKDELQFYLKGVNDIVTGLQEKFPWLIVPMEIEAEITQLREDGGNFSELREIDTLNPIIW